MFKLAILVSFFLSINLSANELPSKDLSSPRATMHYFLKSMKATKLGNAYGEKQAVEAFDLSSTPEEIRSIKGLDYARSLISVLDRIEYIKIETVPEKTKDSVWYYRKEKIRTGENSHNVEISIRKINDEWLFTTETINSLNYYDQYLSKKKVVDGVVASNSLKGQLKAYLPEWAFHKKFLLANYHWILLLAITLLSFILDRIVRVYVARRALSFLEKRKVRFSAKQQDRLTSPFGVMTFCYFFSTFAGWIDLPADALAIIAKATSIIMAIATVLILNELLTVVCLYFEDKAHETENKIDDILVPLLRKTARFFIFSVGLLFIGDALDLNMKNILAGMGIGGIAFALAAKDTISNVFGSFTVLFDNPFTIGDWVKIDSEVEGIVEEVGLRSTRIRTFYNSVMTVPNGNLISANIDNLGRRQFRRFHTNLALDYATPPEKIENFCESLRQLIIAHPKTRKDSFQVYFNSMGDFSLNIMLYMFWEVPTWDDELNEKHKFLVDILKVAKKHGIVFAFPTQTLHTIPSQDTQYEKEVTDFNRSKELISTLEQDRWNTPHRSSQNQLK